MMWPPRNSFQQPIFFLTFSTAHGNSSILDCAHLHKKSRQVKSGKTSSGFLLNKIILINIQNCIFLFCLLLMVGCDKEEECPELRFSLSLTETRAFSTTVTVTHNGTNRNRYYAFVVPGNIININIEIQKHSGDVSNGKISNEAFDQKKRVVLFNGLRPDTQYTCIVYGVDDNGGVVGTPCSLQFSTESSSVEFVVNPKWELKYIGQDKYDGKTYSRIDVNVKGDAEERYFICVYDSATIAHYQDISDLLLYAYKDFCSEHNEFDNEFFWIEDKFVRTQSTCYYRYLFKGQYQAFAIGIDTNGEPTGHYACSAFINFEQYELEPGYGELLGNWEFSDIEGNKMFFTLSEKWANSSFTMSDFGNAKCPVTINYAPTSAYCLTIPGQSVLGQHWGEDDVKIMTLRPWYLNKDDQFRIYTALNVSILARCKKKNIDGTYTFTNGFSIKLENNETATTIGILLTYKNEDNGLVYYSSSKLQFPFTMKKID